MLCFPKRQLRPTHAKDGLQATDRGVCFLPAEGTNGRLPNQDLLNTVTQISRHNPYIPIRLYQQPFEIPELESPSFGFPALEAVLTWIGSLEFVRKYLRAARGLGEHWKWAGLGRSSGVHGVFLQ